ncbi:UV DNA damage repair endonuclease UvsE [Neobacillus notoginsengisoli]|uniref:UV DNA damage repair endonuclease UvsE n=1 Tax=Neobacillus notoginsengisoli TaxID=1578198 RepID=A0A417YN34_9BACI|nr:UV DNA damage repair endonuclease UvsE [Neobacillus notoginsengisoli]RHW34865.1 UV DNA damage repair endonuclease UvsE [Neobacillus notoginsengisoli]
MTIVRLGYVAMSTTVPHCSPSQTMTFAHFQKLKNREAALRKLERIALSNLTNCLRLLRHNSAHDIRFFRFSSRLIPLANHEELSDWDYISPLKKGFQKIAQFITENPTRIDFHPDHFVVLNTNKQEILRTSIQTLSLHYRMLKEMGIPPKHRCVIHIGGGYNDKEKALEMFIHNWGFLNSRLQEMIMLENDDTTFTLKECLYLCEKLGVPCVFDYHHHLAHHAGKSDWEEDWERVIASWAHSPLRVKMHISSPKSEREFRAHAEYIDPNMFMDFLQKIKGSVPEIDCMIEAKGKDAALFKLMDDLKLQQDKGIEMIDQASFFIK